VTEAEWLAATDPQPMLQLVFWKASERKRRLFACACARSVWELIYPDLTGRYVELSEDYADGRAHQPPVAPNGLPDSGVVVAAATGRAAETADAAAELVYTNYLYPPDWAQGAIALSIRNAERALQSGFLRDVFGNPFRPVPFVAPAWLSWNDGTLPQLARAAYEERQLPKGTLDPARLAFLAGALKDAGCTDAELLGHLTGPGPHVRGCWALDLLLAKV
jgi:hypothetical protein